jgi:DNA-binding beta-propeller fold protein YncE
VSRDSKFVYVANEAGNSVSQYSVGANGALTPLSAAVATASATTDGLAISPDGKWLYAVSRGQPGASITRYSIGADGKLTNAGSTTPSSLTSSPWKIIVL